MQVRSISIVINRGRHKSNISCTEISGWGESILGKISSIVSLWHEYIMLNVLEEECSEKVYASGIWFYSVIFSVIILPGHFLLFK